MMSMRALVLAAVAVSSHVAAFGPKPASKGWCPQDVARTDADVSAFVAKLANTPFQSDKFKLLTKFLAESSLGLGADDINQIIDIFTFSGDRTTALDMIQPFVLGYTCDQEITLLDTMTFDSDQIATLNSTCSFVLQSDDCAKRLVDFFPYASSKAAAQNIIDNCPGRSCVYGTVTAQKVIFVVDTSGSMGGTFKGDGGETTTRLSFVAGELDITITDQLPKLKGRMFNVLRFSSDVAEWKPGLQPATNDNLFSAVQYVQTWSASGGTGTKAALQKAYSMDGVEAIYLLSDGMPNGDPNDIVSSAKAWSNNGAIPCNTIALVAGGSESVSQKNDALGFMEQLATATGGTYRGLGAP